MLLHYFQSFYRLHQYLLLTTILIWASEKTYSQTIYEFDLDFPSQKGSERVQTIDLNSPDVQDFVAVSFVIEGSNLNQHSISGTYTTAKNKTHEIFPAHEGHETTNRFVSELFFLEKEDANTIQIHFNLGEDNESIYDIRGKIRIFIPENNAIRQKAAITHRNFLSDECNCTMLPYVPRSVWGTRYQLNENIYTPPATYTQVTHLIIHHSAGTNFSNDWAGVVAAYFDYHVNTNGWQDIGYNWLIDPNGVLYEGRGGGDNIQGAHMCGYNENTMGICMLGNFEVAQPTDTMMQAVKQLLGYKACKENIDPKGDGDITSYPGHMFNISGHKDGCSPGYTSCPGKFLHEKLTQIRQATEEYIESSCESTSTQNASGIKPNVYPNPATNQLCGTDNLFSITDILGNVIRPDLYTNDRHCTDISRLLPGLYQAIILKESVFTSLSFVKL